MKKKKHNPDKEKFEKIGFISYKSSDAHIKVRPSYLDIPTPKEWRPEPAPLVKLNRLNNYPKVIRMMLKSPGPLYSFLGHNLTRDWCKTYGLTTHQGHILTMMSFHEVFFPRDLRVWCINLTSGNLTLKWLCENHFIKAVKVPNGHGGFKKRVAYVLSTLGLNFVEGYEAFYENKMEIIRQNIGPSERMQRLAKSIKGAIEKEKQLKEEIWNARILGTQPKRSKSIYSPLKDK